MGSLTDYMENKVLDTYFGASPSAAPLMPTTIWFGLSTTTIADDGSNVTEPSGSSYSRVGMSNNKTTWSTAAAGALSNAAVITFPQATGSWGTVLDFFLASSNVASGASPFAYGTLGTSKSIQNLDTPSFAATALAITLT